MSARREGFESATLGASSSRNAWTSRCPRARRRWVMHPITKVMGEIVAIFRRLGFELAKAGRNRAPQLRCAEHARRPSGARHARHLLSAAVGEARRAATPHASPVQIRAMKRRSRRCASFARRGVSQRLRHDAFADVSSSKVCTSTAVSFAELKGALLFLRAMFGAQTDPASPELLPFVEPGTESMSPA